MSSHLLSLSIWLPILGALIVLATGSDRNPAPTRYLALLVALAGFLVTFRFRVRQDRCERAARDVPVPIVPPLVGALRSLAKRAAWLLDWLLLNNSRLGHRVQPGHAMRRLAEIARVLGCDYLSF